MPDPHFMGRSPSLSELKRQDRICDRFEAGWRSGSPPRIEELLAEVPESERAHLFVALVRIELDRRTDSPGPVEFRFRFPAFIELVDFIFRDPVSTGDYVGTGFEQSIHAPRIAGYEVTGTLGQGGMGVVFRGRHIGLDRPVAIKMIRTPTHSRPDQLVRFQLEARAVAGLGHPNVVPLYDFGEADGQPYLVMELVEGGSLAGLLGGKPAEPLWAATIVEQLARAVHHIHDRKIIHRDLKPANVLLANDGTPKITDFGLAKSLVSDDPGLTETYAVLGTACYMSPEQARGDSRSVGPASDVYALGGILYECLTGRPPFRAATYALTVALVLEEDPPRPSELVEGLSPDLEAVCLKCLEKDPGQRYTAIELAEDLARFLQNIPVLARPLNVAEWHARWAKRIGYELGELLDATSRGFTYLARQTSINRTVRLKLSAGMVGSPSHAALRREADAMSGLEHPNVIRLYTYGEEFGQPYLVLEHIEGGESLGKRLPVSSRQAAEMTMMLAIGIQAVHERGWLHAGLHPEAILLTRDGTPKIGNFAAARRQDDPGEAADWVPTAFQAPEVRAASHARIGRASDLYSLGAILHDLLHGESDPEIGAIVAKCLESDPKRRYQTAGAVALAVQLFLAPRLSEPNGSSDDSEGTVVPGELASYDRSASRYRLRVISGPDFIGATFAVSRYRVMIGRAKSSNVLLDGVDVSRVHCGIIWNDEARCHELVDLAAYNGTFVNEKPVRGTRRLKAGDHIRIAKYTLIFEAAIG